jgi:hypothetical protein
MQKNNNELLEQNAKLQNELYALKSYLNDLALDSIQTNSFVSDSMVTAQFRFIPSNVVNISFLSMKKLRTRIFGLFVINISNQKPLPLLLLKMLY